jgi:hypothetical protein
MMEFVFAHRPRIPEPQKQSSYCKKYYLQTRLFKEQNKTMF